MPASSSVSSDEQSHVMAAPVTSGGAAEARRELLVARLVVGGEAGVDVARDDAQRRELDVQLTGDAQERGLDVPYPSPSHLHPRVPADPMLAVADAMFTTRPPPRSSMPGTTSCTRWSWLT